MLYFMKWHFLRPEVLRMVGTCAHSLSKVFVCSYNLSFWFKVAKNVPRSDVLPYELLQKICPPGPCRKSNYLSVGTVIFEVWCMVAAAHKKELAA